MKSLLIGLFVLPVIASTDCDLEGLPQIDSAITEIASQLGPDHAYCNPEQVRKINEAYNIAQRQLGLVRSQARNAQSHGMNSARTMLDRIAVKLPEIKIYCVDPSSPNCGPRVAATAMAPGLIGRLADSFSQRRITFCQDIWDNPPILMAAQMVHEVAHKVGASDGPENDHAYFGHRGGKFLKPASRGEHHWSWIAATYEFWIHHGFCNPDNGC